MERQSWRGWCVWGGWRLAIGNIEDLAGAMVQRDEAREGGGREGEKQDRTGAGIKGARRGERREGEGEEGRGAKYRVR